MISIDTGNSNISNMPQPRCNQRLSVEKAAQPINTVAIDCARCDTSAREKAPFKYGIATHAHAVKSGMRTHCAPRVVRSVYTRPNMQNAIRPTNIKPNITLRKASTGDAPLTCTVHGHGTGLVMLVAPRAFNTVQALYQNILKKPGRNRHN